MDNGPPPSFVVGVMTVLPSAPPEAALVAALARGEQAALDALYARYARMVHAILLARVAPQDAEELTQDVFLLAAERVRQLDDPSRFGPWIAQVARNRAVDHLRRRRRWLPWVDPGGREDAPRSEANEVLCAIRTLPEAYQETLLMRLCEELTGPEIAERTQLTPESVRVNLHRGMKLLRAALGEP